MGCELIMTMFCFIYTSTQCLHIPVSSHPTRWQNSPHCVCLPPPLWCVHHRTRAPLPQQKCWNLGLQTLVGGIYIIFVQRLDFLQVICKQSKSQIKWEPGAISLPVPVLVSSVFQVYTVHCSTRSMVLARDPSTSNFFLIFFFFKSIFFVSF